MRHIGAILLVLALLGVFILPGLARQAGQASVAKSAFLTTTPGLTGTPALLFPLVFNPPTPTPTPTPTNTPTATKTPTPTNTPLATATRTGVPGATGLTGRLVFVENKTRYYTNVEWIKFWEQIYNPTGGPLPYTLLGVNVWKSGFPDANMGFHTSWTGGPDWVSAGCWGPNGYTDWNTGHRCAPNDGEGWHQDHVGDASNIEITTPGHYYIVFWACQSSYAVCTGGGAANWRQLGSPLHFDADQNPAAHAVEVATQMPQTTCKLITDDPENIYLDCQGGLP
jgi:hypothetical protein